MGWKLREIPNIFSGRATFTASVSVSTDSADAGPAATSGLASATSIGAAAYIGFYVAPIVGGGTSQSAVKLLRSDDGVFRRTGLSRLNAMISAGHATYLAPAIEESAGELLVSLASGRGEKPGRAKAEEKAEEAAEALRCLESLVAVSEEIRVGLSKRAAVMDALAAASRDRTLAKDVRERLASVREKLKRSAAK